MSSALEIALTAQSPTLRPTGLLLNSIKAMPYRLPSALFLPNKKHPDDVAKVRLLGIFSCL
jgi:hypothetical protein